MDSRRETARMGRHRAPGRGPLAGVIAGSVLVGLLGSGALVWQTSQAAFSATTANGANNWNSGSVQLTDDDGTSGVMFNVSNIKPGQSGERCIVVTYNGSLAASVKLYGTTSNNTTLAAYVQLTVESGTGSSFAGSSGGTCTGFVSEATIAPTDTLVNFGTTHTNFGNGAGSWSPTANNAGQTKVYRFAWSLPSNAPDAAQNKSATATFTWEAQNT